MSLFNRYVINVEMSPHPSNRSVSSVRSQRRDHRSSQSRQDQNRQNQRERDIYQCLFCKKYHPLKYCKRFLSMDIKKRQRLVERYQYCANCLARSHVIRSCTSMKTCRRCDKLHHTLLHSPRIKPKISTKPRQRIEQLTTNSNNATPDTKILSEAIRSLAQVLCVSGNHSSIAGLQGRRYV